MKFFICNETDHDSKTFARNLVFERENPELLNQSEWNNIYLAPHRGRARYCNAHVCLFLCLCVCVFVCPCFRKISKCNISAISQPIIMKLGIHITYGYTVTDKYFQNFRSKVKVVGRRKVKNVIWPYLGNEWSMRYNFQDRPVSKFGPPILNCDKSHFSQLPCIRRHNSVISQPITMKFGTHTGGAAGEVCHLWLPC